MTEKEFKELREKIACALAVEGYGGMSILTCGDIDKDGVLCASLHFAVVADENGPTDTVCVECGNVVSLRGIG